MIATDLEHFKALKRERLARLRDAKAKGAESLEIAILETEISELNIALRTFQGRFSRGHQLRGMSAEISLNAQQHRDWIFQDEVADDVSCSPHEARLKHVARAFTDSTTQTQREYLLERAEGKTLSEIGKSHGVDKSTICRGAMRARKNAAGAAWQRAGFEMAKEYDGSLDARNPKTLGLIMSALTAEQAVIVYLRYVHKLTLACIGEHAHIDKSTVSRTAKRALYNIGCVSAGVRQLTIKNLEALEDAAYMLYHNGEIDFETPTGPGGGTSAARLKYKRAPDVEVVLLCQEPQTCLYKELMNEESAQNCPDLMYERLKKIFYTLVERAKKNAADGISRLMT